MARLVTHEGWIECHQLGANPGWIEKVRLPPVVQGDVVHGVMGDRGDHCSGEAADYTLERALTNHYCWSGRGGAQVGEGKWHEHYVTAAIRHNALSSGRIRRPCRCPNPARSCRSPAPPSRVPARERTRAA